VSSTRRAAAPIADGPARRGHLQTDSGAGHPEALHPSGNLALLSLGALGVVFGDIGTSPLYALKECINPAHGLARTPADLLGILSLIFWSLTMVVTLKYVTLVLRADNRGEGGIFAMLALLPERRGVPRSPRIRWISCLVMIGASLLYGEGVITPAISVLSAVEGLQVAAPRLEPLVVPLTLAILLGLFAIQKHGTGTVGRFFGPVMAIWFLTIACLGLFHIVRHPDVLRALSPIHAVAFFAHHGLHGTLILGSVVLAFTGGEALYADMGHFGARPIRMAWLGLAMPALVLWGAKSHVGRSYRPMEVWGERGIDVSGKMLPCGHYPAEQAPEETYAELRAFFSAASPRRPAS